MSEDNKFTYKCSSCDSYNKIGGHDRIYCRECDYRVLYKPREDRISNFRGR